jgi:hypothetical protein
VLLCLNLNQLKNHTKYWWTNELTVKLHESIYCDSNTKRHDRQQNKNISVLTLNPELKRSLFSSGSYILRYIKIVPHLTFGFTCPRYQTFSVLSYLFFRILPNRAARSAGWTHFQLAALTILDEVYTALVLSNNYLIHTDGWQLTLRICMTKLIFCVRMLL